MVSYGEAPDAFPHTVSSQPFSPHPALSLSAPQTIPAPHSLYLRRSSVLDSHSVFLTVGPGILVISHLPVVVHRCLSMHIASSSSVPPSYARTGCVFPTAPLVCSLISSPWEKVFRENSKATCA